MLEEQVDCCMRIKDNHLKKGKKYMMKVDQKREKL